MIRLYKFDGSSIRIWTVQRVTDNMIEIAHGVSGGSLQRIQETVPAGLAGRSLTQQVESRMNSRASRMRDKGYKDSVEAAHASQGNQLGLDRPMLAQTYESKFDGLLNVTTQIQLKLDGHRCLVTRQNGKILAYSRQGKEITQITHIIEELSFTNLEEGETLDGELYCHGIPLQTIGSWIKRKQPDTLRLKYFVYDLIDDTPYIERQAKLKSILSMCEFSKALKSWSFESMDQVRTLMRTARENGYEGLMFRLNGDGYQCGKRARQLLKYKEFEDAEFEVIDIVSDEVGHGKAICRVRDGVTVTASCPGDHPFRKQQLAEKEKFIGKFLTLKFAYYTVDGIPFQPVALRYREDI